MPHLLRLIEHVEFDTIYHEHYYYFSLHRGPRPCWPERGLRVFDVEELPTHGGSLRMWVSLEDAAETWPQTESVERVLDSERAAGLDSIETYAAFAPRVERVLDELRGFLQEARAEGARVAAYGAAAKGNTLLNSAGVGPDDIAYVLDRSPHKQGLFTPGSHVPVFDPEHVRRGPARLPAAARRGTCATRSRQQMAHVRDWGCRFVVPVPHLEVVP